MKKIMVLIIVSLFAFSCEKEYYLIPGDEIPQWLRDRIAQDEAIIESNPRSGLDCAAWIRYRYKRNYYYEYVNLLSSSGPKIYDHNGERFYPYSIFDYQDNRSNKMYVWKGDWYID